MNKTNLGKANFSTRLNKLTLNGETKSFFKELETKKSQFWSNESKRQIVNLFENAREKVPAYKKFLGGKRVKVAKISCPIN